MDNGGDPLGGLIMFLAFILLDAVLFGFGTAIRTLNDGEIQQENEQGNKKAQILERLKAEPEHMSHTIQFAATLLAIVAGGIFLNNMTSRIGILADRIPEVLSVQKPVLEAAASVLAVLCLLFFFYSLGILLPKKLGKYYSRSWAFGLLSFVCLIERICRPLTYLSTSLCGVILKGLGIDSKELQEDVTEEEILSMVNEGHEQGVLEANEAEMINNIFELGDKEAQDIMTHRKNIVAVNGEKTLEETLKFMLDSINSRFPVYKDNIDNITGILHLKDAMRIHTENQFDHWLIKDIPNLVRPALFIPETRNISQLFQSMQSKKIQMVMVADEYGQTAGLVAMEDILEEIVGNIQDEYDEDETLIQELPNGSYLMDGMTPIEEVHEILEVEFGEEEFETLNGYLIFKLGKIPDADESSEIFEKGYSFKILSVENKTIKQVKVSRQVEKASEENDD